MFRAPVTAALMAALPQEVRPFLRRVQAKRRPQSALPVWEFACRKKAGVAVLSGLGASAAARAAAFLVARYQPQVFISLGFGGTLTPEVAAGALVVGARFWEYEPDAGVLQELEPPPVPAKVDDLVERLRAAGLAAFRGSVVTTPTIIHKDSQGGALRHLTHPVLDLETAAAAAVVRERGVPFLALRAVTDAAGEEIPDFIRQAARDSRTPTPGTALAWLARDPRRLAVLFHLWRRSCLAAENLARGLEVVLEML
jgi:adenosylhomocysteine nucleosidase